MRAEAIVPKTAKVVAGGKTFEIRPMTFSVRAKVTRVMQDAFTAAGKSLSPEQVEKAREAGQAGEPSQFVAVGMEIFGERLRDVYAAILKVDPAWVDDNLEIKDELAVWKAVLEVNDLPFLIRELASIRQQFAGIKSASKG